jgi:hypothetical protein
MRTISGDSMIRYLDSLATAYQLLDRIPLTGRAPDPKELGRAMGHIASVRDSLLWYAVSDVAVEPAPVVAVVLAEAA